MSIPLGEPGQLLTRLVTTIEQKRPITFLFGSAITAAYKGSKGVATAPEMVEWALKRLRATDWGGQVSLPAGPSSAQYQAVMQHLVNTYGQDALNELVKTAVLAARSTEAERDSASLDLKFDEWELPAATVAAGAILARCRDSFQLPILTSNFDPLLEIAVRRAGRDALGIFLTSDGRFDNVVAPDSTHIVHLHGYWRGSDTLHTPTQLQSPRPELASGLRELLRGTTLVVMGYGGWDDIFTSTLFSLIAERSNSFEVLWCLHSSDAAEIEALHAGLIRSAAGAIGTRLILYKGIDCHVFLPELAAKVAPKHNLDERQQGRVRDLDACDYPPQTAAWVGRSAELRILARPEARVIAITGIGGQGKSALAAEYLSREIGGGIEFWDWRDCKEAANTFLTQLALIVGRLDSAASVNLQGENESYIVETFFEVLGQRRALIVFDNTDQYVDIEQSRFLDTPGMFIETALRARHNSRFIFTCRPRVEADRDGLIQIPLAGLNVTETSSLFALRGVHLGDKDAAVQDRLARVLQVTNGHPLWLNMIATQVALNGAGIDLLLDNVERGHDSALPRRMLREIVAKTTAKQQKILHYMAEFTSAESEQQIAEYCKRDLNFNQLHKGLRVLKSLDLVVVKRSRTEETLELHPLVRDFIRQEYPRPERENYITSIIAVIDSVIAKINAAFGNNQSFDQTRFARSKVELCLNAGRYIEAATVLQGLESTLLRDGHSEEFVRLALPVVERLVGAKDSVTNWTAFDRLSGSVSHSLSELGRFHEADDCLGRLEASIPGKNARFINLCDQRCYSLWCRGDFELAIEWGKRGDDLKTGAALDTEFDCAHNLALARRDAGDIDAALAHFLRGIDIDVVIAGDVNPEIASGSFFGNIGRCLQLQEKFDWALPVLTNSAKLLEDETDATTRVNRGWAALWLGEVYEAKRDYKLAYMCFAAAAERFKSCSPPRSRFAETSVSRVSEHVRVVASWDRAERQYGDWLRSVRIGGPA